MACDVSPVAMFIIMILLSPSKMLAHIFLADSENSENNTSLPNIIHSFGFTVEDRLLKDEVNVV